MNLKKLTNNFIIAVISQGVSLLVSVLMTLLVPKYLGIAEYGYWQLFIFYSTYVGFFHFGLNDGIYLLNGGTPRSAIDKRAVNSQLILGFTYQAIMAAFGILFTFVFMADVKRAFVLFAIAIFLVLNNTALFFGYLFQAMNETKLYSMSIVVDRVLFMAPFSIFLLLRITSFEPYVVAYCISKTIALGYCAYHARDFLSSGVLKINEAAKLSFNSIRVGCNLMFANIADILILGVGRFLVDNAWGIEAFGKVSFSLSLVNFFITFVTQASMVLFPALRQGSNEEQRSFYGAIRDAMEILFPALFILYFPMVALLKLWLPQYADSMIYFAYLLPVCVFNTKMDVCCTTYFKVLRMERTLLFVNVSAVIASLVFALAGVYLFNSLELVLLGAVTSIALRSLWSEKLLNRRLAVEGSSLPYEELLLTALFILCALLADGWMGSFVYGACFLVYLFKNKETFQHVACKFSRILSR